MALDPCYDCMTAPAVTDGLCSSCKADRDAVEAEVAELSASLEARGMVPGTYAFTAAIMAHGSSEEECEEWDRWKDDMKAADGY